MSTDIEIIDNFLPDHLFEKLQDEILGNDFPWFVCGDIVNESLGHIPPDINYNWQLFHLFYYNPHEISRYFPIMDSLLVTLQPMMTLKIKANLNPVADRIIEHGMHVDTYPYELAEMLTTSVFYLNTNNGYTAFEDGTKVESVANRLVSFPASMMHTGTTCTDEKYRAVINLNYVKRPAETRNHKDEI
jgi:hypothetical protein